MYDLEKDLWAALEKASSTIQSLGGEQAAPRIGIILGTGLGRLAQSLNAPIIIPYEKIPGFPRATAESHAGRLILGKLKGVAVAALQGRFHYYEGYSLKQITFPVRVMKRLGCISLIVSNACGGLNPEFHAGDLMALSDHLNLLPGNPLVGLHDGRLGPHFPDMSQPYSKRLRKLAQSHAQALGLTLREGVYAAMTGPSLETRAEYRMLRILGADAIGMSTVPETIVAVQSGLEVLGLSVITDECVPETLKPVDLPTIIKTAEEAEPKLVKLIESIINEI